MGSGGLQPMKTLKNKPPRSKNKTFARRGESRVDFICALKLRLFAKTKIRASEQSYKRIFMKLVFLKTKTVSLPLPEGTGKENKYGGELQASDQHQKGQEYLAGIGHVGIGGCRTYCSNSGTHTAHIGGNGSY